MFCVWQGAKSREVLKKGYFYGMALSAFDPDIFVFQLVFRGGS
jgi:hypothetical protein